VPNWRQSTQRQLTYQRALCVCIGSTRYDLALPSLPYMRYAPSFAPFLIKLLTCSSSLRALVSDFSYLGLNPRTAHAVEPLKCTGGRIL
jgi:hypothetical protein